MRKKTIALVLSLALLLGASNIILADESKLPFSDVKTTSWYYSNLVDLYSNGIINGFEDGTFKGTTSLKKDQMLKLVITTIAPNANYNKMDGDTWFKPYLRICRSLGIEEEVELVEYTDSEGNKAFVDEDVSKKFNVDIAREDIAVYTYKALLYGVNSGIYNLYTQVDEGTVNALINEKYKDAAQISSDKKYAIYALYDLEIMQGDDNGKFNPKQNLTRAEATAIIYRLRQVRDKFEKEGKLETEKMNQEISEAGESVNYQGGTKMVIQDSEIEQDTYTRERIEQIFASRENMVEEFGIEAEYFTDEEIESLYEFYLENMLEE